MQNEQKHNGEDIKLAKYWEHNSNQQNIWKIDKKFDWQTVYKTELIDKSFNDENKRHKTTKYSSI